MNRFNRNKGFEQYCAQAWRAFHLISDQQLGAGWVRDRSGTDLPASQLRERRIHWLHRDGGTA